MPAFNEILFPVDFSPRSKAAAPFVLSMAQRFRANVTLLHVVQPLTTVYGGFEVAFAGVADGEEINTTARERLSEFAAAELPKLNVACVVETGEPARTITEFANVRCMKLIALPTHGYGAFRRVLLGSVAARVLHDTKIPLWTSAHCPEPSHTAHPQPRQVLCALDLKSDNRSVLETAIALTRAAGATLEILHVAPEGEVSVIPTRRKIDGMLATAAGGTAVEIRESGGSDDTVLVADPNVAKVVRETAMRHRSDLIVIGRSSGGFKPAGIGSDAYKIIRESPCPVLSV